MVVLHIKTDRIFGYRNFYFEKEEQSSVLSSRVSPFHHGDVMVDWSQVVCRRIMYVTLALCKHKMDCVSYIITAGDLGVALVWLSHTLRIKIKLNFYSKGVAEPD